MLIIEHMEEEISEWLLLEYEHASALWEGEVWFTNVRKGRERLSSIGRVFEERACQLFSEAIVLDPKAEKPLTQEDFYTGLPVVVGGILGYEKPLGRTAEITESFEVAHPRNLGKVQLSIDSACLVAKLISLGFSLEDLEITSEVEIQTGEGESVILPYGYLVLEGSVILTPGLVDYLIRKI